MAVGFVSRQQQVFWHLMSPLNPTRLRIWQRDREMGEPADILDGTQKYTGKETRRARGGTKAEENCHCYEELWVRCCHRYSMAFPLGECCWINALLWHSEAGEHSPKKKSMVRRWVGSYAEQCKNTLWGERTTWKADKTLPVTAPESYDIWSGWAGVVI